MTTVKSWDVKAAVDRLVKSQKLAGDALDLVGDEVAFKIVALLKIGLPQESIEEIVISQYATGEKEDEGSEEPRGVTTTYGGAQTRGIADAD